MALEGSTLWLGEARDRQRLTHHGGHYDAIPHYPGKKQRQDPL